MRGESPATATPAGPYGQKSPAHDTPLRRAATPRSRPGWARPSRLGRSVGHPHTHVLGISPLPGPARNHDRRAGHRRAHHPHAAHRTRRTRAHATTSQPAQGEITMPDTSPDDAANLTTLLGEFGGLGQISRTPQGYTAQRRPRAAPPLVFTVETVPAMRQLLQHGYDTAKLAAIMRDFAAGWELEHLDPGSAWAAASRDHPTQI